MALIKCSECEHDISMEATICPHCGIPLSRPETLARKPVNKSKRKVAIAAVLLLVSTVGGGVACFLLTQPHPSVALCERLLISQLKSPSSYKAISKEMVVVAADNTSSALIHIEYEAANSYNAMTRSDCYCTLGAFPADKRKDSYSLHLRSRNSKIGSSPFDTLNIVEVEVDSQKFGVEDIPPSMTLISPRPFYTKPGPGFILGWHGDGSTDYILSREKPSQAMVDDLKAAMLEDYAKQKEYLDKIIELSEIMSLNDATRLRNLAQGVWRSVSHDKEDLPKLITKSSHKYAEKIAEKQTEVRSALANLYNAESTQEIVKSIQEQQAEVRKLIEEVQSPPKGLEQHYSIISSMYVVYKSYTNSAINPYGEVSDWLMWYTDSARPYRQSYSSSAQQWVTFNDYSGKLDELLPTN